ncbi:MAG: aspartate/glutamate racemase family protein [Anaerolineales bacterium]
MPEKIIGILGGQGPEATLDLFRRIIKHTPAKTDQEHFHTIINCNPRVPNPNYAITRGGEDPTPYLCANAVTLEKAGADFIVIPCNTVHIFLEPIQASIDIPILSIVEAATQALLSTVPGIKRVGLLATPAVTRIGLYAKAFERQGIETIILDEQGIQEIHDVIFAVKAGDKSQKVRDLLLKNCQILIDQGIEALVLGCTELPLLVSPQDLPVPTIDTLETLAMAAVRYARGES